MSPLPTKNTAGKFDNTQEEINQEFFAKEVFSKGSETGSSNTNKTGPFKNKEIKFYKEVSGENTRSN